MFAQIAFRSKPGTPEGVAVRSMAGQGATVSQSGCTLVNMCVTLAAMDVEVV